MTTLDIIISFHRAYITKPEACPLHVSDLEGFVMGGSPLRNHDNKKETPVPSALLCTTLLRAGNIEYDSARIIVTHCNLWTENGDN